MKRIYKAYLGYSKTIQICIPVYFLLALLVAIVACNPASPSGTSSTSLPLPTSSSSQTPGKSAGETLVVLTQNEPNLINPQMGYNATDFESAIFSNLLTWDQNMKFLPDLAREVPTLDNGGISSDGLTYTWHLRDDVRWHDGQPFTAKDVAFTWKFITTPGTGAVSATGYDLIRSIETPDDHTVRMTLKEQSPPFIGLWGGVGFGHGILPEHLLQGASQDVLNKFNRAPIGTGSFRFEEWVPADHISVIRNDSYYGKVASLNRIVYRFVPNDNTAFDILQAGQAQLWWNVVSTNLAERLAKLPNVTVYNRSSLNTMMLFLNNERPLLSDQNVRLALAYGLNREGLVKQLMRGYTTTAFGEQDPSNWAYDKNLTPYPFDPAKARDLLDSAGWTEGPDGIRSKGGTRLAITLSTVSGESLSEQMLQVAQQQWRAIGVDASIKNYEIGVFFGEVVPHGDFDTALFYNGIPSSDPDPFMLWHSSAIPTKDNNYSGWNFARYRNPELDHLIEQGRTAAPSTDRLPIYYRIQELLHEQQPVIFLYYVPKLAAGRGLNGLTIYPISTFAHANEWILTSK